MAFGTMIVILSTGYLQSLGITLGFLPTALLALPIGIIATVILSLFFDKTVFKYYRDMKVSL